MKLIINTGELIEVNIIKEDDIYSYYYDGQKIGVYNPKVMKEKFLLISKDLKEEFADQIKDSINELNTEEIEKEASKENLKGYEQSIGEDEKTFDEIKEISKILKVHSEEIKEINEMDLNQKIEKDDKSKITDSSSLGIKETTNLNENIKGTTLAKKLGIENMTMQNGQKLTDGVKLARVSTSSLNKYTDTKSNMVDSFVIIRENGEVVPIGEDILKQDTRSGINSINDDLTINNDGSVDREINTSSYKIVNGNGKEFIKVGHDEISGREIKYSQWSDEKGEYVDTELKTSRDIIIDDDTRQYLKARGEGTKEATETLEKEENHKDDYKKDVTLIDHDKNNDSHVHINEDDYIPNTNMTWREFANECGYRGEGALEKAQEKFKKAKLDNEGLSNQDIAENIIEEENEEYRGNQTRGN